MNHAVITSNRAIFEAPQFRIIENTVDYGNGLIKTRTDVYKNSGVSIFPVTDDFEIYLIKQYRYLHGKTVLEGIAGFIDEGESPLEAAKRELKEETGLKANSFKEISQVQVSASVIKASQYLFLAKNLTKTASMPEETEKIELIKLPLNEAAEKVMEGEIEMAFSSVGILMLDKMRREGKL